MWDRSQERSDGHLTFLANMLWSEILSEIELFNILNGIFTWNASIHNFKFPTRMSVKSKRPFELTTLKGLLPQSNKTYIALAQNSDGLWANTNNTMLHPSWLPFWWFLLISNRLTLLPLGYYDDCPATFHLKFFNQDAHWSCHAWKKLKAATQMLQRSPPKKKTKTKNKQTKNSFSSTQFMHSIYL